MTVVYPRHQGRWVVTIAGITILALGLCAQDTRSPAWADNGPPNEHFSLPNAEILSKEDAILAYGALADGMARAFALSGYPPAIRYRTWKLLNNAPYRSDVHGDRYVNNYANAIAVNAGYGRSDTGKTMPPGSVLVKDSFTATKKGGLFPGALFVMEKLSPGASPATRDWRYVMLLPDGSLFGDSQGEDAAQVVFCHDCHGSQAPFDDYFSVPKDYRQPVAPGSALK